MASIFQRGKGRTWWIKYYANGRQVYYSLGTKDARVVKRIKRQIEGEEANGELIRRQRRPYRPSSKTSASFLRQLGLASRTLAMFQHSASSLVQFVPLWSLAVV